MKKARKASSLDFDGAALSFFPDLARETLDRCRAMRPLTEKLRAASISYRWGFLASLIANRDGKTAILPTWQSPLSHNRKFLIAIGVLLCPPVYRMFFVPYPDFFDLYLLLARQQCLVKYVTCFTIYV